MSHLTCREKNYREMSQPDVRAFILKHYKIDNETFIKYVYDGYTHDMGYKPIRKIKARKKVQLQFHAEELSKQHAHEIIKRLINLI